MIQKDFYNIIEQTGLIRTHGEELGELVSRFPYASSLQLLYTKSLKDTDAVLFNSQLHDCAVKVSDRKRMYEFIHQQELIEVIQKVESQIEGIEEKPIAFEDKTSNAKSQEGTIEQHLEVLKDEQDELNEEDISEVIGEKKKGVDELEQLIISEAINYSIQSEVDSEVQDVSVVEEDSVEEKEEIKEKQVRNISSEKHSFVDWFSVSDEEKVHTPRKDSELVNLVDTFIKKYENDKSQENKEISFYSPENVARLSLVDSEEFVTETLANVYVKQGLFSKAIRIYEQLILINPEKKTFFASRIRFLKEKQQYKND